LIDNRYQHHRQYDSHEDAFRVEEDHRLSSVVFDKPHKNLLDMGTEVVITHRGSTYYCTTGTIIGYDPERFWDYMVKHHKDGYCWWRPRSQVAKEKI
jgi:hypothetical protein